MEQQIFNLIFTDHRIEGYERVVEVKEENCGLHAIIALHDTTLGPALGGTRAYPYTSFDQALNDVLRLSKGMTYKAALTESGTGGGKSVIIANNKVPKSKELLHAFAEAVNAFQGNYICAEDIGMQLSDVGIIHERTRYAVGVPHPKSSNDPSPFTAFGGFRGIQAVCKKLWGTDSVEGRKIAIQGLGAVGAKLAELLFWHGAELILTDIDKSLLEKCRRKFGAKIVAPEEILSVKCDIFTPCAMGGVINENTVPKLQCQAVAGLANNQLLTDADGEDLFKRGILYAPDYAINAGGLLNVCVELHQEGYNPSVARMDVDRVYDILLNIFNTADEKHKSPHLVANEIAEYNLQNKIGKRQKAVIFHH